MHLQSRHTVCHHVDPERLLNLKAPTLYFSNNPSTRVFSSNNMVVDLARFDKAPRYGAVCQGHAQ